jgi:hypothetical protein
MRDCQIGLQHAIFSRGEDKLTHLYKFHEWVREELYRYPDSPKMHRDDLFNNNSIWYICQKLREILDQCKRMEKFKKDMQIICQKWKFRSEIACLVHKRHDSSSDDESGDEEMFWNIEYGTELTFM